MAWLLNSDTFPNTLAKCVGEEVSESSRQTVVHGRAIKYGSVSWSHNAQAKGQRMGCLLCKLGTDCVHGVRYTPTRKAPIHRDGIVSIDALMLRQLIHKKSRVLFFLFFYIFPPPPGSPPSLSKWFSIVYNTAQLGLRSRRYIYNNIDFSFEKKKQINIYLVVRILGHWLLYTAFTSAALLSHTFAYLNFLFAAETWIFDFSGAPPHHTVTTGYQNFSPIFSKKI